MQALYVLCLCGIVVMCKKPHKVENIFYVRWLFLYLKGGDMMGQKDDVLTDDLRKVNMQKKIL